MGRSSSRVARALAIAAIACLTARTAFAQEQLGAKKIEIESALLGGGVLIVPSNGSVASQPKGYMLDVGAALNLNSRFGLEGDFAWSMRRQQTVTLALQNPVVTATPNMLFYTANLVVNPFGKDHRFVPYVEAGAGGLSVLSPATTFGLNGGTHTEGNIGGGLRLFIIPHWGARIDYRYIAIGNVATPAAGVLPIGHANRIYGAVILTF